ncbi:MAG TPA: LysM peptidoglycan-binding domain-containing M23 family metallopeptidase [Pseudolabrys sp.]|nr:LysM peptidoglycan-binding domain-containing M23 family metallopeptidase [Pseudolabrys sp.]
MPRSAVSFSSRISPRIVVLASIALGIAGCSDSQRFDSPYSNPFSSRRDVPETTGSVSSRPMPRSQVASQPLPPPPSRYAGPTGVATGGHGIGAYQPQSAATPEVTGSIGERHVAQGHWTWDGGKAITVKQGETVETLARKYHVPVSALMQANGMTRASWLRPGQRLVIPRYVASNDDARPAASRPAKTAESSVHVVGPGDTLIGIARRHGMTLAALAKANNLSVHSRLNIGDRITIPAGHRAVAERHPAAPVAQARAKVEAKSTGKEAPVETVASVPTEHARLAKPEPAETDHSVKKAEAVGSMPSFRWPVRGRIISAFGPKSNGQQNDGINLAVPEGTPIKAADDGVVAYAGNELKGYGNLVLIRHANGYVSAYANASELLVKRGDKVHRGQVIARAGQTGNVTSPQLHFEIRKGSVPVDPTKFLSGA